MEQGASGPRVRRDRVTSLVLLSLVTVTILIIITITMIMTNSKDINDQNEKLAPTRTIMMLLVTTIADGWSRKGWPGRKDQTTLEVHTWIGTHTSRCSCTYLVIHPNHTMIYDPVYAPFCSTMYPTVHIIVVCSGIVESHSTLLYHFIV